MLSSAKIGVSSWRYYTAGVACAPTEYYLGRGEAPGRWHGRGLAELGLTAGELVSERELEALFARGLHPGSGQRLGRAWRTDAVTGFDLTFSAPKSVSTLWALGGGEVGAAVIGAHRAAVRAGLAYLDHHAGLSRTGTDGTEQVATAGLAAACFDHRSSRAGDPQLHTHALVVNKVRCTDGGWRTLDAVEVFHHKKSAGMLYQAALRAELHSRLGVGFDPVSEHGQAEVAGVPAELLTRWSTRTAQITAEAEPKIGEYEQQLGRTLTRGERARVVKTAVLVTRPAKAHPEPAALHTRWQSEAQTTGWTPERLLHAVRAAAPRIPAEDSTLAQTLARPDGALAGTLARGGEVTPAGPPDTVVGAVRAAGRRGSVFSRADVVGQTAASLALSAMAAGEVLARVEQLTDQALRSTEAVPLGAVPRAVTPRASDPRYASVEVLTAETRILTRTAHGRGRGYGQAALSPPSGPVSPLAGPVSPPSGPVSPLAGSVSPLAGPLAGLDAGQARAVARIVGGGDLVSVLTAPAGAGKTRTLGAATALWQQAGYRVVGIAPSARAAAELGAATGIRTDTLAKWLHTRDHLPRLPAGSVDRAWAGLDARTMLIIDEASMVSTLDLDRVTALTAQAGAKVVLVGDPAQIGVINGPGGMLAALTHAGHGVELTEIHRFTHPWERQASRRLRTGDPDALTAYHGHGRLHACGDAEHALDRVFTHWAAERAQGADALMLARTRADVDALNTRARAAAVLAGQIRGPLVLAGGREWQAGDLLLTRRNDRRLACGDSHVRNGDRWHVLGPAPDGGLVVDDRTGRGRLTLPADYLAGHCDYGWASTIDAAQGATADVGIVLVRPGLDREHLYVGLTRGRHANHAYTTSEPSPGDTDHHQPPPPLGAAARDEEATQLLAAALASSGAQHTAHTFREQARHHAAATAAPPAGPPAVPGPDPDPDPAMRPGAGGPQPRSRPGQQAAGEAVPLAHVAAIEQLRQLQRERQQLHAQQQHLAAVLQQAHADREAAPRWALGRRRALAVSITSQQALLEQTQPRQAHLDTEIPRLRQRIQAHAHDRAARAAREQQQPPPASPAARQGSEAAQLLHQVLHQLPDMWTPQPTDPHTPAPAAPRYPGTPAPSRGRSR